MSASGTVDAATVATARKIVVWDRWWSRLPHHVVSPAMLLVLTVAVLIGGVTLALGVTGTSVRVVESPSMGRAAPVGTLVVDRSTSFETLRVGDVITYRPPESGGSVTHRIVEKTAAGLRTRGDINGAADSWTVRPAMVIGRAAALVPGAGWFVRLGPWVVLGILALGCLTLPISSSTIRAGVRVVGTCAVASVIVVVQRPLVGWSVLTQTPTSGGVDAAVVGTGLLPIRLTGADGRSVAAQPGEVVHLLLAPDKTGRIAFDVALGLGWSGWCCAVLICLVPLMAVLAVGLPGPSAEIER